jgi:hypothetical protein
MANDRDSYVAPPDWKHADISFMVENEERLRREHEERLSKSAAGASEDGDDKEGGGNSAASMPGAGNEEEEDDEEPESVPSWEQNEAYRRLAFEKGLIRPFTILLSMTQIQRLQICGMLGIRLAGEYYLGDPHAEAWSILAKKRHGMQDRLTEYNEKLNPIDTKVNWYEMVYRLYDEVFDEGVRAIVPRETCMGGHSIIGDSFKPTIGANTLYSTFHDDFEMLHVLEQAFLLKVEAAQHYGVITPAMDFYQVKEGDQSMVSGLTQNQAYIFVNSEVVCHALHWMLSFSPYAAHLCEANTMKTTNACMYPIVASIQGANLLRPQDLAIDTLLNRADHPGMQAEERKMLLSAPDLEDFSATEELQKLEALTKKAVKKVEQMFEAKKLKKRVRYYVAQVEGAVEMLPGVGQAYDGAKSALAAGLLLAKIAVITLKLRFGSSVHRCMPVVHALVSQRQRFEMEHSLKIEQLYSHQRLHCTNCQRLEKAEKGNSPPPGSSVANWPEVEHGSRWMYARKEGTLGDKWSMQHVVVHEGTVATFNTSLNEHPDAKPLAHFPITPSTQIATPADEEEEDDGDDIYSSSNLGRVVSGLKRAGKVVKRTAGKVGNAAKANPFLQQARDAAELATALASVPRPEVIALCSNCGFASPIATCESAGELQLNAIEGDRRKLLEPPAESETRIRLRLTLHSVHAQRLDNVPAKTDLYERLEQNSLVVQDSTGNKLEIVPCRPQDSEYLVSCLRDTKNKTAMYSADSELEDANVKSEEGTLGVTYKLEESTARQGSFRLSVIGQCR